jgi:hypothetical protein
MIEVDGAAAKIGSADLLTSSKQAAYLLTAK